MVHVFSRSLAVHPFPDVARAIPQLHPFRLAAHQESDDRGIDQPHFVEVQYDVWPVSHQAGPQLAQVLGVDSPADPEHDRDLESHRAEWANVTPRRCRAQTAIYVFEKC